MIKVNRMGGKLTSMLLDLPVPFNISNFWNFGSCLGLCLGLQLFTGLFLASHYNSSPEIAFDSVEHLMKDVSKGWLFRLAHLNGASFFFLFLFLHISRGLYYSSYHYSKTWMLGVAIFFLSMAIAFMGYVLPWGQMSFWGATVITNLISSIPKVGIQMVYWIWGGFSVSAPTLSRFFMIHFCLPFILSAMVILHIYFLHKTGSNNPTNIKSSFNLISFHSYFSFKDMSFFFSWFLVFEILIFLFPFLLGDPENFLIANSLSTPAHIVPEWYFLFAYAILRSIPSKLGGVIALMVSVLILTFPALITSLKKSNYLEFLLLDKKGFSWMTGKQLLLWFFLSIFLILTWLGGEVVEDPFIIIGQIFLIFYFSFLLMLMLEMNMNTEVSKFLFSILPNLLLLGFFVLIAVFSPVIWVVFLGNYSFEDVGDLYLSLESPLNKDGQKNSFYLLNLIFILSIFIIIFLGFFLTMEFTEKSFCFNLQKVVKKKMLFFYFFNKDNKWIFSGVGATLFFFLLVVLIAFVFSSISVDFYGNTKLGQKLLYSQLVSALTASFSFMNFVFIAHIDFKKSHSLTLSQLEKNFEELKEKDYWVFVYSIFLSSFSLFLVISFLNLGLMVFLGVCNSALKCNMVFFCGSILFLLLVISLIIFLFPIPKTQEMKEPSKFWGVVVFGSIFFGLIFVLGMRSALTIFFNWLTLGMAS